MNDALYEQLISRRPKAYDLPVRILVILVIVAVALLGMPFVGYNKSKRKRLKSLDIQGAEIIAPKGSPRLNSYKPDKIYDYSSGNPNGKPYAIMISLDQKNECIYIEPDAKMIDHMKQWMGMKMYQD